MGPDKKGPHDWTEKGGAQKGSTEALAHNILLFLSYEKSNGS